MSEKLVGIVWLFLAIISGIFLGGLESKIAFWGCMGCSQIWLAK